MPPPQPSNDVLFVQRPGLLIQPLHHTLNVLCDQSPRLRRGYLLLIGGELVMGEDTVL